MKTLKIALLAAALSFSACKSDGDKVDENQNEAAAEQPTQTSGAENAEEPAAIEQPETAPTDGEGWTFFQAAKQADKLVVTDGPTNPVLGGKPVEITDAEWLTKFHAAAGDGPGAEAVPKCLPTYQLTFFKGDTEVGKYSAVCANTESAVFVRNGQSFAAENSADVIAMLKALGEK